MRLEQLDRLQHRPLRVRVPAAAEQVRHDPGERVALAARVARPAPERDRQLERVDRPHLFVREVVGAGLALEEGRALVGGQAVGEAERPAVLSGCLTMGAEEIGPLGSCCCEPQHGVGVAGRLGVMRQPGIVAHGVGPPAERGERTAMEAQPASRLERLLDREPRQVVAELDRTRALSEHPRRERLLEGADVLARQRFEEPQLGARRGDGDGVEQRTRIVGETGRAGEHGIAHGFRDGAVAAREHLRDEERVPAGQPVQLDGVDLPRGGQLGDGVLRERRHREPCDLGTRGELADHDTQRVSAVQVVPVRRQDEHRRPADLPRQQPERVERGLVRPVDVLEDDDRRRTGSDGPEQRSDHLGRAAVECLAQISVRALGDIEERPERPGREEGVAAAPEHAHAETPVAKVADRGRLAHACLAGDQHEATSSGPRLVETHPQAGQHLLAFEQADAGSRRSYTHALIVGDSGRKVYGRTSTRPGSPARLARKAASAWSSGKEGPTRLASSSSPAATSSSRRGSATAGSSEP